MTRKNAATLGVVLWAFSLLWSTTFEDVTPRSVAIWGVSSAIVIALATVAARTAARALKRAAGEDT